MSYTREQIEEEINWPAESRTEQQQQEMLRQLLAENDALREDAERWGMLPAVAEDHQIDLMRLYRDIDAARAK